MSHQIVWIFGRGLSIGCNLTWDIPPEWQELERGENIIRTREAVLAEMDAPGICTISVRQFLGFLAQQTKAGWRHLFLTTNWDYLLQRELLRFIPDNIMPAWLSNGQVFHLNGTVEGPLDDPWRSPFLLPKDSYKQRTSTGEADDAYSKMIWETTFVVVGMSFESETDRFLLNALNTVEDDLPIGESEWFVVNPDPKVLAIVCKRIQAALPDATVIPICLTLEQWREQGFRELLSRGIFNL